MPMKMKITWRKSIEGCLIPVDLERCAGWAKATISVLKQRWEFTLPEILIVRPLYTRKKEQGNCGRAGKGVDNLHFIAINLYQTRYFTYTHSIIITTIHETVHIVVPQITGQWGHGKLFNEMIRYALQPKNFELIKKGGNHYER